MLLPWSIIGGIKITGNFTRQSVELSFGNFKYLEQIHQRVDSSEKLKKKKKENYSYYKYAKGLSFCTECIPKGYLFCQKMYMYIKGYGVGLPGGASSIEFY